MKLALIADLHANREAASAVLEHAQAQGSGRYAFLGDYVGYGADPAWVVDMVRSHVREGAIAVRGNHDQAVAREPARTMVPQARAVLGWTREQLDAAQLAFLEALPLSVEDGDLLFVHANAFAPAGWDYITDRSGAMRSLRATRSAVTFCGHVHEPMLYHYFDGHAGEFAPTPGVAIPLLPTRRWLVLPGSAGQPRDGNPAACYAIFETVARTLTFHRVPYDHELAAEKVRAAGLPVALAERLVDGQ